MNPGDEPRRMRQGEDAGEALRRLEGTVEELGRNTEALARTVNETLALLAERVEAIERAVLPAGAAKVHKGPPEAPAPPEPPATRCRPAGWAPLARSAPRRSPRAT
jgi:hypothetical protein